MDGVPEIMDPDLGRASPEIARILEKPLLGRAIDVDDLGRRAPDVTVLLGCAIQVDDIDLRRRHSLLRGCGLLAVRVRVHHDDGTKLKAEPLAHIARLILLPNNFVDPAGTIH